MRQAHMLQMQRCVTLLTLARLISDNQLSEFKASLPGLVAVSRQAYNIFATNALMLKDKSKY
jgi:hypothetical protein